MRLVNKSLLLLVSGLSVSLAAPQSFAQEFAADHIRQSPFEETAHEATPSGIQVTVPSGTWQEFKELHEHGGTTALLDFVLPDREPVNLILWPVEAMSKSARARVVYEDKQLELTPKVVMFRGYVEGSSGSFFLALSPNMVNGFLQFEEKTYFLTTGNQSSGQLAYIGIVSEHSGGGLQKDWCDVVNNYQDLARKNDQGHAIKTDVTVREADVFVECDNDYRGLFSTDQDAIDYAVTLMGAANEVYRRDLGIMIHIPDGYLRVWNTVPPWGPGGYITDIRAWWISSSNPDRDLPRASVHTLTHPVFGGVAWAIGGLCDNSMGYQLSSVYGSFPFPIQHTSGANWDLFVVTHEFGHTFGSRHTFDYLPPISCNDGSGPDNGTIMSYCHGNPGGVANVGMRLHARVQEEIRNYTDPLGCLTDYTVAKGDYDLSGTHDSTDLAAFDAYLNQGFDSIGSMEIFDMDGNQVVDSCDRTLLEGLISGFSLQHTQTPLFRGQPATFTASQANAGESVYFLYSLAGIGCGPCPGQLGGMCLEILDPIIILGSGTANASGVASYSHTIPATAPLVQVFTQAVAPRGTGGSQSVRSKPVAAFILP